MTDEIAEDKPQQPANSFPNQQIPNPAFPPNGAGFPGPGQMPDPSQINDSQLDMMKDMMGKEDTRNMMKNMMKAQYGMDVSDEQLNMMSGMMNRDTLKMASEQMKNGNFQMPPGMAGMPGAPPQPSTTQSQSQYANIPPQSQTVPSSYSPNTTPTAFPPGQPGAGGPGQPPMADLMANPSLEGLMQNKDMIKMSMEMLKSNPGVLRGMTSQLGENHPVSKFLQNKSDTEIQKLAGWLDKLVALLMACYPAFKVCKNNFKYILGLFLAWLFYKFFIVDKDE